MLQPTREDRFSFGLWTVGWQGVDVFGVAVREPLDPDVAVNRLAELGAYGVSFHDNDVFPFAATSAAEKSQAIARLRSAVDSAGLVIPMITTNLFSHPVFRDGGFTANDREVRRFAIRKVADNLDLAAELGAQTVVFWGGSEGAESGAAKDVRAALDRYKEAFDILTGYVIEQRLRHAFRDRAQAERAPRRHPAPDDRARSCLHRSARAFGHGRSQSGGRSRGDGGAELRTRACAGAVAREAVPRRPQRPARSALRPGPPLRRRERARRLLDRRHPRVRWLRRSAPFRLQAAAH